jgi:hypothetical protein
MTLTPDELDEMYRGIVEARIAMPQFTKAADTAGNVLIADLRSAIPDMDDRMAGGVLIAASSIASGLIERMPTALVDKAMCALITNTLAVAGAELYGNAN